MGFFNFLKQPDIGQGVAEYRALSDAVLLDVRTPQEYQKGHIPGSRNVPLPSIGEVQLLPKDRDVPIFLYCHSGARSSQAAGVLRRMGYTRVKNIGGIAAWNGEVEYGL